MLKVMVYIIVHPMHIKHCKFNNYSQNSHAIATIFFKGKTSIGVNNAITNNGSKLVPDIIE